MTTPLPIASHTPLPAYAALPNSLRGKALAVDAVYLHVPFCSTKCHYCDFYSLAGHDDQMEAYISALDNELQLQTAFFGIPKPTTFFIGGGTPTLLPPHLLDRLLSLLHKRLDLSQLQEFTTEANPNTFDAEKAAICHSHGINRLSFGAQSFNQPELTTLQRDHDPASVPRAFELAHLAGIHNLSLDLIFGIPGQTLASWDHSLSQALALSPNHLSCYSLTYEPNTAMTARLHKGEFTQLDEELELTLFQHVYDKARTAGFLRYETSNYARLLPTGPAVCRHNLHYWKAANWLAFGPSAGAHLSHHFQGYQWKNVNSLTHYLSALYNSSPTLPITQFEHLPQPAWAGACAVFWLRLAEGLDYAAFQSRVGLNPKPFLVKALAKYVDLGLVTLTDQRATITEAGVAVSNRLLSDVLAAFDPA